MSKIIQIQINPNKGDELLALTDSGEIWIWDGTWDMMPAIPELKAKANK